MAKILLDLGCWDKSFTESVIAEDYENGSMFDDAIRNALKKRATVFEADAVVEERKVAHWIMPRNDDGMSDPIEYQVRCSNCGFDIDPQTFDLELKAQGADKCCPRCAALME